MKRRCSLQATPRRQSTLFVFGLLGVVTIACAIPDQAQTVPKPETTKPQQSEAPAAPNASKQKPSKAAVAHQFDEKDSGRGGGQSRLGVSHHFGPNHATSKASPDATAQNIGDNPMADLERQMWVLVNQERSNPETLAETGGRARPLKWNESLAAVARAHSRNMLEQRFFAHADPDGTTYEMRIDQAEIPWLAAGENIAKWDTVLGAEATFMNEPHFQPNHRFNILNALYTDVGIGIVKGADGNLYITQDFVATPASRGAVRSAP
jgi:uncharacterized protein YkwD